MLAAIDSISKYYQLSLYLTLDLFINCIIYKSSKIHWPINNIKTDEFNLFDLLSLLCILFLVLPDLFCKFSWLTNNNYDNKFKLSNYYCRCHLSYLVVTLCLILLLLSLLFSCCWLLCLVVVVCVANKIDLNRVLIIFVSVIWIKLYKEESWSLGAFKFNYNVFARFFYIFCIYINSLGSL